MTFHPYDKIGQDTRWWRADPAQMRRLAKLRWAVTEKIHGANFCFLLQGEEISCAKRKAPLAAGEDFFDHRRVLEQLRPRLARLSAALSAAHPGARFGVFGELFGGAGGVSWSDSLSFERPETPHPSTTQSTSGASAGPGTSHWRIMRRSAASGTTSLGGRERFCSKSRAAGAST